VPFHLTGSEYEELQCRIAFAEDGGVLVELALADEFLNPVDHVGWKADE